VAEAAGGGSARPRGRRPGATGSTGTRKAIIAEARRQFGEVGYGETSLRAIAAGAGVDPRLVLHYFGTKKGLFLEALELPLDIDLILENVFSLGARDPGRAAATFMVTVLEEERPRQIITGLLRAAVSEPEAAELVRELITGRLLLPVAERLGGAAPALRASLAGTQVIGLVLGRYVVRLPPLAAASREQLIEALAPVLAHYLGGDWYREEL
jgi:AcrR family transcriptional regulator